MNNEAKAVARLIDYYGTNDVMKILQAKCAKVTARNYKKQRGWSHYCLNNFYVDYMAGLDEYSEREVLGHELGHIIRHASLLKKLGEIGLKQEDPLFDYKTPTELEANRFAAYFLIDPKELEELLREGRQLTECAKILHVHVPFAMLIAQDMQRDGIIPSHCNLYVPPRFMRDLEIDIDEY